MVLEPVVGWKCDSNDAGVPARMLVPRESVL